MKQESFFRPVCSSDCESDDENSKEENRFSDLQDQKKKKTSNAHVNASLLIIIR
jgi:hypothetical protein